MRFLILCFLCCFGIEVAGQLNADSSYVSINLEPVESLIADSDFQESIILLNNFQGRDLNVLDQAKIKLLQGQAYYGLGEYPKAEGFFNESYQLASSENLDPLFQTECVIRLAETYETMGRYEQCLGSFDLADKILAVSAGPKKETFQAEIFIGKGDYHDAKGNYETSKSFYQQALNIFEQNESTDSSKLSMAYNRMGYADYYLSNINSSLDYFQKAMSIDRVLYGKRHPRVSSGLNNLASIFLAKGDYDRSLDLYKQMLENDLNELGEDHFDLSIGYNNVGTVYLYKGDYNTALEYYKTSRKIFNRSFDGDYHYLMNTLNKNIGQCYEEQDDPDRALTYYQISLDKYLNKVGPNHPGIAKIKERIGRCQEMKGNLALAMKYYQEALQIAQENFESKDHLVFANYERSIANILLKENKLDEANALYKKSNEKIHEKFGAQHPDLARNFTQLAQVEFQRNNYPEARNYFASAYQALNYNPEKPTEIDKVNSILILKDVLEEEANFYSNIYERNQDTPSLEQSLTVLSQTTFLLKELRSSFKEDESKRILTGKNYALYDQAIQTCLRLFEIKQNPKYLERALDFSEQLKSNKVLEAFYATKAEKIAGLPDSLLEMERRLKIDINYQKKSLLQGVGQLDSLQIENLEDELFKNNETYKKLVETLESDYPKYFSLKYGKEAFSIDRMQEKILTNEEALIEYQVGLDAIYAFVLTKDTIRTATLEVDSLVENISYLRKGLLGSFTHSEEKVNKVLGKKLFEKYAFRLYEQLIAPLGELPQKLIIIPDAQLGYVPFEVLLKSKSDQDLAFNKLDYLIQHHDISYNYSAMLWQEMLGQKNQSKGLLAIAPVFESTHSKDSISNTASLMSSLEEVLYISKLFKGDTLTREHATLSNFLDQSSTFSILHLATHAKIDEEETDFSCLYFSEKENPSQLFISDLYNLQIPAEMVVLSACETGLGEIEKGEGIISLARGFVYAGAGSIVTSLWRVQDQSTAELMKGFYDHLKDGNEKSVALRQSKLDFIDDNPQYSHPYYWAPFIAIGNMEKIEGTIYADAWTYLIGFGLILFLGYVFIYRGNTEAKKEDV